METAPLDLFITHADAAYQILRITQACPLPRGRFQPYEETGMRRLALTLIGCVTALTMPPADAAEHVLRLSAANVQFGRFDASIPPVLTIRSGDIVDIQTLNIVDPQMLAHSTTMPSATVPDIARDIYRFTADRGPGPHVLTGPIALEGAEPGDVLEVRILKVDLAADHGFNVHLPGEGVLRDEFETPSLRIVPIDRGKRTAEVAPGVVVPLDRPFLGTMGVAPSSGRVSSIAPGDFAGNLDNKELGAGSTLYIPVHARGALFSAGDGHAAQGDGEADLTAVETSLNARLQFVLRKDLRFTTPRGETPTHWIAMGLAPTLDEAMRKAVRETIAIIREHRPTLSRDDAYAVASVAVDYRVTQAVDRTVGIHGIIPKAIFYQPAR